MNKNLMRGLIIGLVTLMVAITFTACNPTITFSLGDEIEKPFVIVVDHEGNPLAGVKVQLKTFNLDTGAQVYAPPVATTSNKVEDKGFAYFDKPTSDIEGKLKNVRIEVMITELATGNDIAKHSFDKIDAKILGIVQFLGEIEVEPMVPQGKIYDSNGTIALAGVDVKIINADSSFTGVTTDVNGTFKFTAAYAEGNYTVTVNDGNGTFDFAPFKLVIDKERPRSWVFDIRALKKVDMLPYGKVVDANNTAIADANVTITNDNNSSEVRTILTAANGTFKMPLPKIPEGNYTVDVNKTGYIFNSFSIKFDKDNLSAGVIKPAVKLLAVTGKVINAKDVNKTGIAGAVVSAYFIDRNGTVSNNATISATADANGTFTFTGINKGEYMVRAVKTNAVSNENNASLGYAFLEKRLSVQQSDITGFNMNGFEFNAVKDDYALSIVLVWEDDFMDCDAILSYPTLAIGGNETGPANYKPYGSTTEIGGALQTGFSPETSSGTGLYTLSNRNRVWWGNTTTNGTGVPIYDNTTKIATDMKWGTFDYDSDNNGTNDTYKIQMDTDCRVGSGPESITIRTFPVTQRGNTTIDMSGAFGNSFNAGYWLGTMGYYVDAYSSTSNSGTETTDGTLSTQGTGKTAGAKVYVFQTFGDWDQNGTKDDPKASVLGIYTIPVYTTVKSASVLRITMVEDNSGNDYYVVYPDIRVLSLLSTKKTDYQQMKSIGNGAIMVPAGKQ